MAKPRTATPELLAAAAEYTTRQNRHSHPAGTFDKAGRWYPTAAEHCSCCSSIRTPSRAWPYSLMVHCRSIGHIAALFGVDATELRRTVRALERGENIHSVAA